MSYQQLSYNGKFLFWIITLGIWATLFAPAIISSSTLFPFQVGKGIFFRIIIEIVLFFYLWLALIEPSMRPKRNKLFWAIFIYLAVLIISTIFSVSPYRSFWGDIERMEGVFGILHSGALFLIVYSVFKRKEDWLRFFKVSLVVSIYVAIYSLRQKYGTDVFEAGSIQPGSTLGNPAFNATYLIFQVFFSAIVFWWDKNVWWRLYAVTLFILNSVILILTAIRGAQAGIFAALIVFVILYAIYGTRNLRAKLATVTLLAVLMLLPVGLFLGRDSALVKKLPLAFQRVANISLERDSTLNTRIISVGISLNALKEKPILGFGPEQFRVGYNKNFNPKHLTYEQAWFDRAHNKISDVAVMTGGLGLISYLAIFIVGFLGLIGYVRRSNYRSERVLGMLAIGLGVAYFVQNMFLFDMPVSYMLFFSSLGFAGFLITGDVKNEEGLNTKKMTKNLKPVQLVLLLAVATGSIFLVFMGNWKPYKTSFWGRQGLAATTPQQALDFYSKAIESGGYPKSEVLRVMTDTLLNSGGARRPEWTEFFVYTTQNMEEFLEKEPLDPRQFIRLGKVYNEHSLIEQQYTVDAERALNKALELAPKRPDAFYELGVTYLQRGENEKAIQIFRDALALNTDNIRAYWTLGLGMVIAGQQNEGVEQLERAVELGYGWINHTDINNLSQVYSQLGRIDKLSGVYQEAVKAFPNNAQYHASLALVYEQLGDLENARKEALIAADLDSRFMPEAEKFIQRLE